MRTKSRRRESQSPTAPEIPPGGGTPVTADALPALLCPAGREPPLRPPLPRVAHALPPLGSEFHVALDRALAELGLELTPGMRAAIVDHSRLLGAWNAHVNLTAIRGEEAVAREHVADSLAAVTLLLDRATRHRTGPGRGRSHPARLLDLGSGPGYPGLPVAVALPVGAATLVDSVSRKVAFLEVAAGAAAAAIRAAGEEPPVLRVVRARAEGLGRDPDHRGRWEVVTARAVAALPVLVELAMPILRRGGILIAWKRDAGDGTFQAELAATEPFLRPLGAAEGIRVEPVPVAGLGDHRLVVIEKTASTPDRFPRPPARLGRPLLP